MTTRRVRLAPFMVVMVIGAPVSSYAYRPFDGTDAAVAETGQIELELGPVQGEQVWAPMTVHINVQAIYGRYRDLGAVASVIVEGSNAWRVRPVAEVLAGNVDAETTYSVLGGAIWQASEDVAIDVALRVERESGQLGGEVRAGLTWAFEP